MTEPAANVEPSFLALSAWEVSGTVYEIASRARLDTRQVIPYFVDRGVPHLGVLRRERPARGLRGEPLLGLEALGIDFGAVDETADIQAHGEAVLRERTGLVLDPARLQVPLPSYARSIGYLTELALPLLLPIEPPPSRELPVSWDGLRHQVVFLTLDALGSELATTPHSEDLAIFVGAFGPSQSVPSMTDDPRALPWRERIARRVWRAEDITRAVEHGGDVSGARRRSVLSPQELRFLRLSRVPFHGQTHEVVTPGSGVTLAMLPYVMVRGVPHFLLWCETRVAVLERRMRQPLYDLPIDPRHLNATACFVSKEEAAALHRSDLRPLVERLLGRALGLPVTAVRVDRLAPGAEPCPPLSSEIRHRVACALDPGSLEALPEEVVVVSAPELSRAVAAGSVRDPVIVAGLLSLGRVAHVDPFAEARTDDVKRRSVFLSTMTQGSVVQRRLRAYSSIEAEQLGAPTYARLMTLLQHEFGVRIAYPKSEGDRGFFKAAFRVFMADERVVEEKERARNRALQGLHWSHDAFHFALGNFTLPAIDDLAGWFASGDPLPAASEPHGPEFERYARALKTAEDEATFFSFWTLFHEKPSLCRHVGKLTFWEATCQLGLGEREVARAVFDAVTSRAELPDVVANHELHRTRPEVRGLFEYMLGFRDYHHKDIKTAWKFASRDVYRGCFLRFGVYEHELDRYLANVRGFQARLDRQPPGLNPLLAACADVRVAIALRVHDVVKARKLLREKASSGNERAEVFAWSEVFLDRLEEAHAQLGRVRARIGNAELVARNEAIHEEVVACAAEVERLRAALWDEVTASGRLDGAVVDAERVRELPR